MNKRMFKLVYPFQHVLRPMYSHRDRSPSSKSGCWLKMSCSILLLLLITTGYDYHYKVKHSLAVGFVCEIYDISNISDTLLIHYNHCLFSLCALLCVWVCACVYSFKHEHCKSHCFHCSFHFFCFVFLF